MRRREFITLAGAAAAWPLMARAQQAAMLVIGLVSSTTADSVNRPGFYRGLAETGFAEGRNVAIEYHWAAGHYDLLPAFVADLVRRRVDVIVALGGSAPGLAAKAATSTIPIVFQTGSDPVEDGLVSSLSRPGGNITGVTRSATEVEPKRLEMLHELVPGAAAVGYLVNPANPAAKSQVQHMQAAAKTLGLQLHVLNASTERELDAAFAASRPEGDGAVLLSTDVFLGTQHARIVALAAQYSLPVADDQKERVEAGGLMSYAADLPETWQQVGTYVGRILKGEKPADLPVLRPTKFELVVNLKTARAIGLSIPESFLTLADEVIE